MPPPFYIPPPLIKIGPLAGLYNAPNQPPGAGAKLSRRPRQAAPRCYRMALGFSISVVGAVVLFIIGYATSYSEKGALGALASLAGTTLCLSTTYMSTAAAVRARGGLDPVDLGVLAALVLASIPFFVIAQSRAEGAVGTAAVAGAVSLVAGFVFVAATSMWVMFVAFEALLLSALCILLLTSKSERARDAGLEMFVWTLVGSAGLLTGFGLLGGEDHASTLPSRWGLDTAICFILGFGVKIPLWPTTA